MTDLPSRPPVKRARLEYTGRDLVFTGRWGDQADSVIFDSAGSEGPSPMDGLLLSLAACMAIDVRLILEKSRVSVDSLTVDATGMRRDTDPRRFTDVRLEYRVSGPSPEDQPKLDRAIRLSREKYCSVLHTLDPDLDVVVTVEGSDRSPNS